MWLCLISSLLRVLQLIWQRFHAFAYPTSRGVRLTAFVDPLRRCATDGGTPIVRFAITLYRGLGTEIALLWLPTSDLFLANTFVTQSMICFNFTNTFSQGRSIPIRTFCLFLQTSPLFVTRPWLQVKAHRLGLLPLYQPFIRFSSPEQAALISQVYLHRTHAVNIISTLNKMFVK